MRIGTLAKKYKISVDSLYYYINIGLIVPPRKGKQYFVDETCERDLQLILTYKKWGFSLKEIHSVLTRYRISCMQQPEDIVDIICAMQRKYDQLQNEIDELMTRQRENGDAKEKLRNTDSLEPRQDIGVPLSMLDLLVCPRCGQSFQLCNARMTHRCITHADVSCQCGYKAEITDGIFITGNNNTSQYDRPDLQREFYRDMPDELISIYQRSYNWMRERLGQIDIDRKILMETHLNAYFSLQFQLEHLEKHQCKVILIDKFPEILALYKDFLERRNTSLEVLFIADGSMRLPLVPGRVDVLIDFFSSNEHQFYNQSSLLDEVKDFLAPASHIVGTYFYLPDGQRSVHNLLRNYPEACRSNFSLPAFKMAIRRSGFAKVDDSLIGRTSNVGANWCFGFMEEGDDIALLSFLCKRNTLDPKMFLTNETTEQFFGRP